MRHTVGIGIVLACLACEADSTLTPASEGTDAGDRRSDAGVTVPDAGAPVVACPLGTEGCGCNASRVGSELMQDDCDPGLWCAPWADPNDFPGRLTSTCVRPCQTDNECGPGRSCAVIRSVQDTVLERICVDRVGAVDEPCGASRVPNPIDPDQALFHPGQMVGCPDNLQCVRPIGGFSPEEGLCLPLCESDADCGPDLPYCNPGVRLFFDRGPVGICSHAQLGSGSICRTTEPNRLGFTALCDTSTTSPRLLTCTSFNLTDDLGVCTELCSSSAPCEGFDEGVGPHECVITDPARETGICMSRCNPNANTCMGDGIGYGRVCTRLFGAGTSCFDRQEPTLRPAQIHPEGWILNSGDPCLNETEAPRPPDWPVDWLSCPTGTQCVLFNPDFGICAALCNPTDASSDPYCQQQLDRSEGMCVDLPTVADPTIGLCSG